MNSRRSALGEIDRPLRPLCFQAGSLGGVGQYGQRGPARAPLKAVAQRQSQGIDATEGGYHDWTSRGSLASETLDQAIFTLPVGRLSERLEDSEGFHIVRVIERTEAGRVPFEQAQVDIKETLRKEHIKSQVTAYVAKLEAGNPRLELARSRPAPSRRRRRRQPPILIGRRHSEIGPDAQAMAGTVHHRHKGEAGCVLKSVRGDEIEPPSHKAPARVSPFLPLDLPRDFGA